MAFFLEKFCWKNPQLLNRDVQAINLCRQAVQNECRDGDVYFVLAKAKNFHNNRLNAVTAIIQGIAVDRQHGDLQQMQAQLGVRAFKPVPFLPRNSFMNNLIGKLIRKK